VSTGADDGAELYDLCRAFDRVVRASPLQEAQAMPSEFAKGDLVELKSGGPKMTVVKVERQILGGSVTCAWFHEDKLQHGVFEPETIRRVDTQETPSNRSS
jgi:uncharacterized protein YodC (DUF2158 family)